MPHVDKVAIIGLDCADPTLVFERWLDDLPHLKALAARGLWGRLESCIPPITVPAWSCMASGKDPGALGIYGFRDRRDWSYENLGLATNLEVRQPRLWDHVARAGKDSIILGVPQTFPIVRPPRGCQVTCFLTPSTSSPFTHPPELADEIQRVAGSYILDVAGFHSADQHELLQQIRNMATQRFAVARHLLTTRPWSLFWMVEMGVDRIQHGFWQHMDPTHQLYTPGNPFENAIHDYYVLLDRLIGELLTLLDLERTALWIVSDHGAQRLDGSFCLNDWLIREGLLTLKTPLTGPRRFDLADVDWSRTQAWGDGGYTGRCYINLAGREPHGIVSQERYAALRAELAARLSNATDRAGQPLGHRVYKPEDIYTEVCGVPPDLLVLCSDLRLRCAGAVGHPDVVTTESEAGPDGANHAQHGLYILVAPGLAAARRDATLYDVAPTSLKLLRIPPPRGLRGRALVDH